MLGVLYALEGESAAGRFEILFRAGAIAYQPFAIFYCAAELGARWGRKDRNRLAKAGEHRHSSSPLNCKNVTNWRGNARAAKILK